MRTLSIALATLCTVALAGVSDQAFAQSYKCKGADGKIEYSDRPCAADKDVLSKPTATGITSKPVVSGMQQLQSLFMEYEERLCEREGLSIEMDAAYRSGEVKKSEALWKPKQDRLNLLNDTLIEFQSKAGKVTQVAGNDSGESAELRKFQRKLKTCSKGKSTDVKPAESKASEVKKAM